MPSNNVQGFGTLRGRRIVFTVDDFSLRAGHADGALYAKTLFIEDLALAMKIPIVKLVDEKKALSDISTLNRHKKGFAGFASQQKSIDDIKSQISDLKKGSDNPEVKALNDRYDEIQKQLNEQKAL